MKTRGIIRTFPVIFIALLFTLACSFLGYSLQQEQAATPIPPTDTPVGIPPTMEPPTETVAPTPEPVTMEAPPTATEEPTLTPSPTIEHEVTPPEKSASGLIVYDVVSKDTAAEKRAPYGDSYRVNRLERPFLQDMSYVPDLDIHAYRVSQDSTWLFVSIRLVGSDPNNQLGIDYAVELDTNEDGFGDYLILAHPPYSTTWEATPVQVYADQNRDTGGLSAMKSDTPFTGDGYETLVFDGGSGEDPDLAWVRVNAGTDATVQFAFKKKLAGSTYLLGVIADAGLKDHTKLDYVDRFSEEEAGSPVRDNQYYPLKELFAVDNACRQAYGFTPSGFEAQMCPYDVSSTPKPKSTPNLCQTPQPCSDPFDYWNAALCKCVPQVPF